MYAEEIRTARSRPPTNRLRPHTRKTILVIHVIASVALLGEVWTLVALNLYSTLAADNELARAAYQLMDVLVFAGGIPLSMTALVTGVALALGSHWGLVRHYWVFAKLLLLIAVICLGMFLFQPGVMAQAIEQGSESDTQQWRQVLVVTAQLIMLVTATTLSVFKPKGRIGWRSQRAARSPGEVSHVPRRTRDVARERTHSPE
ncbi:hypothetical protein EF847_07660 [Actinobacteria bacterium YIM 96077]|uniref:DUF2269 domain-containing protein n=1 Tax=Phytoactinopolyspora halophila TaxID=1981511 RepID=A0A329QJU9_9ACTN|nr:hypothetical protein [Phytoactinopolyspora halophila]AYY12601.1 hypothetical protein EF847_07660 [Actinobacteria bacterium YIM 96077]RAW12496.1 hypothetical protein DPM12_13930 [Phytoactinopolyspora halophila]